MSCGKKIEELPEYKKAICSFLESNPGEMISFASDEDTIEIRVGDRSNNYYYTYCSGRNHEKCPKASEYCISVYYRNDDDRIYVNYSIYYEYFTNYRSDCYSIEGGKNSKIVDGTLHYDSDSDFLEAMKSSIEYMDEEGRTCMVIEPGVGLKEVRMGEKMYRRVR